MRKFLSQFGGRLRKSLTSTGADISDNTNPRCKVLFHNYSWRAIWSSPSCALWSKTWAWDLRVEAYLIIDNGQCLITVAPSVYNLNLCKISMYWWNQILASFSGIRGDNSAFSMRYTVTCAVVRIYLRPEDLLGFGRRLLALDGTVSLLSSVYLPTVRYSERPS